MDKVKTILGVQVRKRRKELCLTKAEIATKIGVSENYLSDIENGKKFPKFGVFINEAVAKRKIAVSGSPVT